MESKIIGYRGIANSRKVIIMGHAFEKHKVRDLLPHHGRRKNLKQMVRRFRARPLKRIAVDIRLGNIEHRVRTDSRGFFTCELPNPFAEPGWHPYELYWKRNDKRFSSEFYFSDEHETGVISDIDDTLLVSHSTRLMRKMILMLFKNAHTRKPIPFLVHFFHHLQQLNDEDHPKDYFYVSNTEWNLYDFLVDFFAINELPKGVFFLQNLKKGFRDFVKKNRKNHGHKISTIEFLLQFYPQKNYILVGDNGQKDMDIYHRIVARYPERIKGVMIRKLAYIKNEKRINYYKEMITGYGVPFVTFH